MLFPQEVRLNVGPVCWCQSFDFPPHQGDAYANEHECSWLRHLVVLRVRRRWRVKLGRQSECVIVQFAAILSRSAWWHLHVLKLCGPAFWLRMICRRRRLVQFCGSRCDKAEPEKADEYDCGNRTFQSTQQSLAAHRSRREVSHDLFSISMLNLLSIRYYSTQTVKRQTIFRCAQRRSWPAQQRFREAESWP